MCECKKCGKPSECEFSVCINCFLEMSDGEATKNMASGGRFYVEKLEIRKVKDE